jgi:uncharacterized membrane protein YeaQ/YmgE (transglycosylase-associated protein family)
MHFEFWCALKATGIFLACIAGFSGIVWGLVSFMDYYIEEHPLNDATNGIFTKLILGIVCLIAGSALLFLFGSVWLDIFKAICPMAH